MTQDNQPIISICGCGRPVTTEPHLATQLPNEPRHHTISGKPVACPE